MVIVLGDTAYQRSKLKAQLGIRAPHKVPGDTHHLQVTSRRVAGPQLTTNHLQGQDIDASPTLFSRLALMWSI